MKVLALEPRLNTYIDSLKTLFVACGRRNDNTGELNFKIFPSDLYNNYFVYI